MARLEYKNVVVTGASAGIGAELARLLAERGCRVVLAARRKDLLEQVAADVQTRGGKALVVPTDVTDRAAIFRLAEIAAEAAPIDVWISNAGGGILHRLLDATEEDMLWQYRLNCLPALWAYQAVVPAMLKRGEGAVVDINSLGGKSGFAYAGGYVAAKSALSGLGDTMRQELLGSRVKVTTIYVGMTETEFGMVRPDRTGGSAVSDSAGLKGSGGLLNRTVLKRLPPAFVARAVIRAIESGSPTAYPHYWGTMAVLAMNLWPRLTLWLMERLRRKSRQAAGREAGKAGH